MTGFNPLDKSALTKIFIGELMERPPTPLGHISREEVQGAGLYGLYYTGDFPAYRVLAEVGNVWPIYLGSALPLGARTGRIPAPAKKPPILERLERHAASVAYAENLDESKFSARWFEVDEPFIILGEILLLRAYRPLWNATVAGFGAKVVGGRRTTGRRSKWDTLHPGRPGMGEAPGHTVESIEAEVAEHLRQFPPFWSGGSDA